MKKIYETMSDLILPAVVFIGIVAIIAGAALLTKAGQRMDVEGEDFSGSADTVAMENICAREAPTITYAGKKSWNVGEAIPIGTVFQAEDADGNPVEVEVRDITDPDGNSVLDNYQEADQTAVFSERGVYTFRISAIDGERKSSMERIGIVVDGR